MFSFEISAFRFFVPALLVLRSTFVFFCCWGGCCSPFSIVIVFSDVALDSVIEVVPPSDCSTSDFDTFSTQPWAWTIVLEHVVTDTCFEELLLDFDDVETCAHGGNTHKLMCCF